MPVEEMVDRVRDMATIRTVFGEPIERDGSVVVPVAKVRGGGGGGAGSPKEGQPEQWGGGIGFDARPLGVYQITEGKVRFIPSVDVNRIVLGGQIVAILMAIVMARAARRRRKAG